MTSFAIKRLDVTRRASSGLFSKAPFPPCFDVVINPFSRFWPPDFAILERRNKSVQRE
jgi:hypothetical protein